jgi:hypothetical protein
MRVSIYSKDEMAIRSKGKRAPFHSNDFSIQKTHDGLSIEAGMPDWKGSGERGGIMREINRKLSMTLTVADLKRLLNVGLSSGLLELKVSARKPRRNR